MNTEKQVDRSYYARPKYATPERFISYQHQISAIRDSGVKKILLIGSGDGVVPYYLSEVLGIDVTIIDIDPELKPDVVGDVRTLPFSDSSFEAVAAFEVLEHIPYEDFPKALSELGRVSQGTVFLSIPYRNTSFEMLLKFPFIKTLLKRPFVRLLLTWPVKFPGFAVSKQHYWEIDTVTTKKKVEAVIQRFFSIKTRHHSLFDPYRYFMLLEKREALSNTYAKEYYDTYLKELPDDYMSARWFANPAARLDYDETRQVLEKSLGDKRFDRTLEIGPGDGVWTGLIIPRSESLTLLDQSEEMLKRAKERLRDTASITYVHSDFLRFDSHEQFDLIFAIRCFEYFDDKEAAVKRFSALLRPGGQLILVTKNPNHLRNRQMREKRLHSQQISRSDLTEYLETAGFTKPKVLSAVFRIKATNMIMRWISRGLHQLHVHSGGWITIPYLTDTFTESYLYVARKK